MENKSLILARRAREENNTEDARKYYDLVRTDDPENVEARFFYAYYRLWDGKKGTAYQDFITFCNSTKNIVKALSASAAPNAEKIALLSDIYESIKNLSASMGAVQMELWKVAPDSEKAKYNTQKKNCERMGIENLYHFADAVEEYFAGDEEAQQIAVNGWKCAVATQQKYPYCGVDKTLPEKYLPKIQKKDPAYVLPKKAGCISFG